MSRRVRTAAIPLQDYAGEDQDLLITGWPGDLATPYDSSAPGTTFDVWTSNANLFADGSSLTALHCPLSYTAALDGTVHRVQLWRPVSGVTYAILGAYLEVFYLDVTTGAVGGDVDFRFDAVTSALGQADQLWADSIPGADAGWDIVSVTDTQWTPNVAGRSQFFPAGVDAAPFQQKQNLMFGKGTPSLFNMPFTTGLGGSADRFALGISGSWGGALCHVGAVMHIIVIPMSAPDY
jgi:hypothetical protein